jgi:hypothetical protein
MKKDRREKKTSPSGSVLHYSTMIRCLMFVVLALACVACSRTGKNSMTLDQALEVTPRDDRPGILEQMGQPDAFRITFEPLNSKMTRYEEWSYFDDQTQFDFMDGTLIDTVQLEPVPDGTIFASNYNPLSFQPQMTTSQVKSILSSVQFTELDTSDAGQAGGMILAGQQILLGFDQGQLVYVETLLLTPEVNQ